ncbi:MAG: hypothetical protein ONB05_03835 [candidate division KSB1 bacterium]|nr:hypothetical protein [candidate division KSB1 bacterium]
MKRLNTITGLTFLYLVLLSLETYPQTISGRLTSAVYTWQQRESDSTSANHIRAYQLAQLTIGNFGLPNLSFHTYLNLSSDFMKKAVTDPRWWLYNCYFELRNFANKVDLSIGRQRVYAGVGYGTVDGLQVQSHFRDYFQIKFYLGTLAPLEKSLQVNRDNLTWGFHVTTAKIKKVHLGLSFAHHSIAPIQYSSPGQFTGAFRIDHPIPALQRQLVGLDVSSSINQKLRLNGRLDFNLVEQNVKRGELGGRYKVNRDFEIGLDYIYRKPYFDFNSIFSVFTLNPNQEFAFHTNYQWKGYRFFFNYSKVLFHGDDSQRIGFGCNWKTYYLGYHRRSGYGGHSDGLTANFLYPVREKLNISLSSNFASYKLYPLAKERDQVLAGSLGLNYQPSKQLSLQAEAQGLRNVRFSRDVRFFFRGSYAFFHRIRR